MNTRDRPLIAIKTQLKVIHNKQVKVKLFNTLPLRRKRVE